MPNSNRDEYAVPFCHRQVEHLAFHEALEPGIRSELGVCWRENDAFGRDFSRASDLDILAEAHRCILANPPIDADDAEALVLRVRRPCDGRRFFLAHDFDDITSFDAKSVHCLWIYPYYRATNISLPCFSHFQVKCFLF